jgi:hypothetical protein
VNVPQSELRIDSRDRTSGNEACLSPRRLRVIVGPQLPRSLSECVLGLRGFLGSTDKGSTIEQLRRVPAAVGRGSSADPLVLDKLKGAELGAELGAFLVTENPTLQGVQLAIALQGGAKDETIDRRGSFRNRVLLTLLISLYAK